MDKLTAPEDIVALVKAQNEAYLIAYRTGYEAGFQRAMSQAMELTNRSVTDAHKVKSNGT